MPVCYAHSKELFFTGLSESSGGGKNRRLETEVLNIKPHLILTVIMSRGAYVRRL